MVPLPRRETVVFAALVAVVGWWRLDLPPARRTVVVAVAVVVFGGASYLLERWRETYLDEHLEDD